MRKLCATARVDLPLFPCDGVAPLGTYVLSGQPDKETMSGSDKARRHLYSNPPGWTLSFLEEWKHYN